MKSDKEQELDRYENRARKILAGAPDRVVSGGFDKLPPAIRSPYLWYLKQIRESVTTPEVNILEIGSGTGMYTEPVARMGASVTATDISRSSLEILRKRLGKHGNIRVREADMEALPFDDGSFDIVLSAGSLSYGDNLIVMNEIYRVLRTGGKFICVDSLNHNPIYRFNRWIQYLTGRRTHSTIERMPTLSLISLYADRFGRVATRYFGSTVWALPLLSLLMSGDRVGRISDKIDRYFNISGSAFKFVMVAEKIN